MKRLLIPLILFLLLIMEGVALDILPVSLVSGDLRFVSHWVFMFLVFLAIFYDREDTYFSVFYGLLFGLLTDIVYTGVLGVYMFSYALSIYLIHGMTKILHANFLVTILLGAAGLVLVEVFINLIFSVTGISELIWPDYWVYRLIPTVIANILFLLALYPIMMKRLVRWKEEQLSGSRGF
ncbi:rod shape-determining protein MreD [Lentibacillus halodurans]|uniref:Rod shape-determining protein MreD n=1 Tax=Lentibacillus halodurans TaxID=237679 RepID=A0A1I0UYG6_9BACI|nr:rod shape-determining protein MreD [Lentibacillus halodurans]SFA68943.1 rod shape-determining protein MreD [Lentibacillus halodurans]